MLTHGCCTRGSAFAEHRLRRFKTHASKGSSHRTGKTTAHLKTAHSNSTDNSFPRSNNNSVGKQQTLKHDGNTQPKGATPLKQQTLKHDSDTQPKSATPFKGAFRDAPRGRGGGWRARGAGGSGGAGWRGSGSGGKGSSGNGSGGHNNKRPSKHKRFED